jgi:hypothetical protein
MRSSDEKHIRGRGYERLVFSGKKFFASAVE